MHSSTPTATITSPTPTTTTITVAITSGIRPGSRSGSRLERASHSRLGRTLRARNLARTSPAPRSPREDVPSEPGFRHPLAPFPPTSLPGRVLLPVIGVNDELTPAFERTIIPVAVRAASGDRIARDALYAAFEPKLLRFVRGVRVPWAPTGAVGRWDRDDVTQEAWLAFLDVLATWEEPIPFGRYVLAHFPWRLRDLVYRGVARSAVPPGSVPVSLEGRDWLADDSAAALESRMLLEALAESFGPPYDDIIRWHIGEGASLMAVAARLGCSRRTLARRWLEVRERLRADLLALRDVS